MRKLLGGTVAAVLLGAAPAGAEPVALRDAPRAEDVALTGDEVTIARGTRHNGVRVIAVPVTGGAARTLMALPPGGHGTKPGVLLTASAGLVAALVSFEPFDDADRLRVYAGPPSGPLTLRRNTRITRDAWLPYNLDADADRLLLEEVRFGRTFATRARVLVPGGPEEPVAWNGTMFETAFAGDRVAFVGAPRGANQAGLYVIARRTGAVEAVAKVPAKEDVDEDGVDLAPDGRAVASLDGRLLTVAPGVAPARFGSDLRHPRFSGAGFAALHEGASGVRTPVIAEGGSVRAIGSRSGSLEIIEADDRGAAWIANGCVFYAARDSAPPAEPPAGPCPRAEVALEEGDQVLRGRRLRVHVTCVAAPAAGCEGTVLLGRGRYGRGRFRVAAGARRTIGIRLTDRGMRVVRRWFARTHEGPDFALSAEVRDGRAHGVNGVLIGRVRR